ncbi:MAG: hypothetical protein AAF962_27675 [Actinomycetota bacterium]
MAALQVVSDMGAAPPGRSGTLSRRRCGAADPIDNAGSFVLDIASSIVIEDRDAALRLLNECDDPAPAWIYPADYDHHTATSAFRELVARFESEFGCPCATSPTALQDTAQHNYIEIPKEAARTEAAVYVLISNYSPLATYYVGPLTVDGAGDVRHEVYDDVRQQIEHSLAESGYACLPMALLWEPYSGSREEYRAVDFTWFTRFFDHH